MNEKVKEKEWDNIRIIKRESKIEKMIETIELSASLDLLSKARCNFSNQDYVNIWGDWLGHHIWRQCGSDLLKIWRSGLTVEQKNKFVKYLMDWNNKNQESDKE